MTDTVNVPLDIVADSIDCFWNAALSAAHERQSEVAADLASVMVQGFAAIAQRLREHAADLKTEPEDAYTSDDMVGLITDEQARHLASSTDVSQVRARMKDILNAQLADKSRRLNPIAPKVEQEPVAWVPIHPRNGPIWSECSPNARSSENLKSYAFKAVFDHPAPASDELLEALVAVCEAIRVWRSPPFDYDFITSAEAAYHALVVAKATIAKHKGPQS